MKAQKLNAQKFLLITCLALIITACDKSATTSNDTDATNNTAAGAEERKLIAVINSNRIYMDDFEKFATQRITENPELQQAPQVLLNELINRELLIQTAEAEGLDQRDEIKARIKTERDSIVLAALLDEKLGGTDLSDEALKAEYDLQLSTTSAKEYLTSHILLTDEAAGIAVIQQLQNGSDFATVAKEKSTGPTKDNGGDLGWIRPETMVNEFASALTQLQAGSFTQAPVQSRFGWHVIKLNQVRDLTPPSFEDSKERLRSILANKAAQVYLSGIRETSTIDIFDPETGENISKPAPAAEDTAAPASN